MQDHQFQHHILNIDQHTTKNKKKKKNYQQTLKKKKLAAFLLQHLLQQIVLLAQQVATVMPSLCLHKAVSIEKQNEKKKIL